MNNALLSIRVSIVSRVIVMLWMAAGVIVPVHAKGAFDGTWKLGTPQLVLRPVAGEVPFTAAGKKLYDANVAAAAKGDLGFDHAATRCSAPGLPRMMLAAGRFNLFERGQMIMVLFEWNRTFRQIDMRGLPLEPDDEVEPRNVGRSVGKWQGATLLVESSGFAEDILLDNFLPSGGDTKLVERIRLVGKNTLQNRITISNPVLYSKPWETVLTFTRQPYAIFDQEDICLERRKAGKGTFSR